MLQWAMIAMDLACAPRVLIVDEPTTALDVTIQTQILDLLRLLQRDTSTSFIFITHDMGVIAEMADDVSFTIRAGETLGLVWESGCVKSTIAKSVIRAVEPADGDVIFHLDQPENLAKLSRERLKNRPEPHSAGVSDSLFLPQSQPPSARHQRRSSQS